MKKWWCKECFLPCRPCQEDPPPDLGEDAYGKITTRTVDMRKKRNQSQEEFEEELRKANFPDFIE